MDTRFRKLGREELGLVRSVADAVWPVTFREILSPEQIAYMMKMMYAPEVMDCEFESGVEFYGVFDGEFPVGYLTWSGCMERPGTAKLHKCYLLPAYQNRGIGSLMLGKAKELARERGFSRLRLNVNRRNGKAIRAYLRNGFAAIGSEDNDIGGGFFMNDYVMEAEL